MVGLAAMLDGSSVLSVVVRASGFSCDLLALWSMV